MKLKKLAIVIGAIGALAASGYALAATYHSDVTYYSDATYRVSVGEKLTVCPYEAGGNSTWGVVTPYKVETDRYDCDYPIP